MRVISKSTIRFLPDIKAEAGLKSWRLEAVKEGTSLVTYAGKNEIPKKIDWELSNEDSNVPRNAGSVEVMFVAEDSLGQRAVSKNYRVPVAQLTIDRKRLERISDKEFEYYSLILFDYGKTDLASAHRKVVDFVKDRLTTDATVYIKGYTDRMGEEDINKRISTRRAEAVARRLKIPQAQVIGLGESDLLYDNKLPEGRFYCRTVTITIETPVKDTNEE
jgi:outer membrane protein OmpA-like peptidoglycan-associated protein